MTLYEQFCALNADFSFIGLGKGSDEESPYWCTPSGAHIIGWEGTDGIHYCFIPQFGSMVFAVNPMSAAEHPVYPLARNFRSFLRLILAAGSVTPLEQIILWSRPEYEEFVRNERNCRIPEQQNLLNLLQEKLHLTPMKDPFAYVKAIQEDFDWSRIPFDGQEADESDFSHHPCQPADIEGAPFFFPDRMIPLNKTVSRKNQSCTICALYKEENLLILDSFMEVPRGENDFKGLFSHSQVYLNDILCESSSGYMWYGSEEEKPEDAEPLIRKYHCDPEKNWCFQRFEFVASPDFSMEHVVLTVSPDPVLQEENPFIFDHAGQIIELHHPQSQEKLSLTLLSCEENQVPSEPFEMDGRMAFMPDRCYVLRYTLSPNISGDDLQIQDSCSGNCPQYEDGSDVSCAVSIGLSCRNKSENCRTAVSSLYFELPEKILWKPVFEVKPEENFSVVLI